MSSSLEKKFKTFEKRMKDAEIGGGEERIEKQHASNKKTARERIIWKRTLFQEMA
jgi:propionyl-CoA carboxylase beta chain